mmetsp:Transcript_11476/g.18799  ORF Transcript_11476/g.18799 Transcript_11476/m.18799 type:complete len:206 (+) Transcript_11476:183-800(+)
MFEAVEQDLSGDVSDREVPAALLAEGHRGNPVQRRALRGAGPVAEHAPRRRVHQFQLVLLLVRRDGQQLPGGVVAGQVDGRGEVQDGLAWEYASSGTTAAAINNKIIIAITMIIIIIIISIIYTIVGSACGGEIVCACCTVQISIIDRGYARFSANCKIRRSRVIPLWIIDPTTTTTATTTAATDTNHSACCKSTHGILRRNISA